MSKIFVFGSNLAGRHGKGAALEALRKHGAVYGRGEGLHGRSYAIPTKDAALNTLHLDEIAHAVARFLAFAAARPGLQFQVTPIGCGLAGYKPEQIGPMFRGATPNVHLPDEFKPYAGAAEEPPPPAGAHVLVHAPSGIRLGHVVDVRAHDRDLSPEETAGIVKAAMERFNLRSADE